MEPLNIRALRTSAGALLSRDKNRMTMILAQAVLMLALVLCLILFYAFSLLSYLMRITPTVIAAFAALHAVTFAAVYLFLICPLIYGLFYMARRTVQTGKAELYELFYAFGSRRRLWCAIHAMLPIGIAGILLFSVTEVLGSLQVTQALIANMLPVTVSLAAVAVLLVCAFSYPRIYCALCDCDLFVPTARRGARLFLRLIGAYAPCLLLGLLTVGVLWIADVFPRMMISYVIDCEDACVPIDEDIPEERSIPTSCDK